MNSPTRKDVKFDSSFIIGFLLGMLAEFLISADFVFLELLKLALVKRDAIKALLALVVGRWGSLRCHCILRRGHQ